MILIFPKGMLGSHWQWSEGWRREKETRANEVLYHERKPTSHRGTIAPMFMACPVNGDHFKRSRPQCVYLANVKFTCEKRRAACIPANTLLPSSVHGLLFSLRLSKIGSFCRARSSALGRGSCSPIVDF